MFRYVVYLLNFEDLRCKNKFVVIRDENAPFERVNEIITGLLERAANGEIGLRHIMMYIPGGRALGGVNMKPVQTLWFESISLLDQPFIDTPIGLITVRQFLLTGMGALVGYAVYRALAWADPFIAAGCALVPFALAAATAARKVKSVPPRGI